MYIKMFFYFFASIAILAALGVIFNKHLVKSMLCLLLLFISTAVLWLLIEAEVLALLLMLIYVGAVLVLFLFVIMIFDLNIQDRKTNLFALVSLALICGLASILIYTLLTHGFDSKHVFLFAEHSHNREALRIGNLLFNKYLVPFEMIGLLLLGAIIAVIGLTEKRL